MNNAETSLRPSPVLWVGFLAAAAVLVVGANLPLVAVALRVIG